MNDDFTKSSKPPFDKLRANGGLVGIIDFIPFVVSLSNQRKNFFEAFMNNGAIKNLFKGRNL